MAQKKRPAAKRSAAKRPRGEGTVVRKRTPRPPATRARTPRKAATRARQRGLQLALPKFEQRALDVIGLGLLSLAVFIGCVLFAHWNGGRLGNGGARGLAWLFGAARAGVPFLLGGAGALFVMRPILGTMRPLRAAAPLLTAACTLALAAGTLGVTSAPLTRTFWHAGVFERRGGALGQAELWLCTHLVGRLGADVIAIFLFAAGVLLVSGASLAAVLRTAGGGVAGVTRRVPALAAPVARAAAARREREPGEPIAVPEPSARELIVRAGHVEAPANEFEPYAPERENYGIAPFEAPEHEAEPEGAEPNNEQLPLPEIAASDLTPQGRFRASVTDAADFVWKLPRASLLTRSNAAQTRPDTAGQAQTAARLVEALGHFGVKASVIGTVAGPHITRYELRLAPGIKVGKVAQLKDDLAYALAATDVRILAPIPGMQAVGVEVPNAKRRMVRLGDVFQEPPQDWSPLTVWLGKDVAGRAIGADLAKMPHLLVAGTTGAGKSAAVNAMLTSILLRASPHEVRLVLVDPKQVELNHYESIPHLLTPVITSPRMAANALANLVREMEQRYGIMSLARSRSLVELNRHRAARGEPALPYILCVIDELADLMMVAPADVEDSIIRLAQKARAVGIHLVLATQSPRVDVITGMIKANVPSRIAFAVSSQTDSRVILDQNGAESLLGAGDMLFAPIGSSAAQRIQGAYVDEGQVAAITDFWRAQGEPELRAELLEEVEPVEDGAGDGAADGFDPDEDALLGDAIALVVELGTASTSLLQRRLRLGYTRAGRLIDMLERRGIISGYEGSKPRQVLVSEADLPRVLAALRERGAGGAAGVAGERPTPAGAPGTL